MEFEVDIDRDGFKGKVKVNFPTRAEKHALLRELKALGYGADDESEKITDQKLALAEKMGEVAEARLLDIDVTHVESGTHITDKAMLDVYHEGQQMVGIISNLILGGIQLSKDKS